MHSEISKKHFTQSTGYIQRTILQQNKTKNKEILEL